jgi:pimeloyl-ACP methyl ester carboxylesterase
MVFDVGAVARPGRGALGERGGAPGNGRTREWGDGARGARLATDDPLVSEWTEVDGLPMHALATRRWLPGAPAVVLVHGLVVSCWYMAPTAQRLVPRFRVLAPDLPGFGRSPGPRAVLTIPALADALARWLTARGIGRAAFVGNSVGCQIAADFAARYPERADRLVLLGPTMDARARTIPQQFGRLVLDIMREPPTNPINYLRDLWVAGPRRGFGTLRHSLDDRIEEKLPRVHAPTLIVRGGIDPIAPQRWVEELTDLLPLGHLVVVPGGTHTINCSAPDAFARLLRPFLAAPWERLAETMRSRRARQRRAVAGGGGAAGAIAIAPEGYWAAGAE